MGLLPHGDGIGREEIKFQLSMPMDSLRRGSVLKVTVLTIVLMLHFEGNIVQERSVVVVRGSLPSPMEMYGNRHTASIVDTKRVVINRRVL